MTNVFARESPGSVDATRVAASEIKVDAKLDEASWKDANRGRDFLQYRPQVGVTPGGETEFSVLYDDENLYIGAWCFDPEPEKILARSMTRDGGLKDSDFVYFFLDTFHDQRNGYVFAVNPAASRYDGLVSNNVNRDTNWDGIWQAKCQITDTGWTAEIAIPFKTVSFDPDNPVWGFNLSRSIRRTLDRSRWVNAVPEVETHYASAAGDVTGLSGLRQGLGIEFTPYVVGRHQSGRPSGNGFDLDFGGDLRYRITPKLSATLSYNTDFAEAEVDERIVNFSRFPLFFPEKRDFFLEDSGIYSFGGLTTDSDDEGLDAVLVPYFTRRIGLSSTGEIVPITFASKLAGRVGDYDIGFTQATLEDQDELGTKTVIAARVSKNILEQSSVGVLMTAGDPSAEGSNYVLGSDFRYRTSSFLGGKQLAVNAFLLGNLSESDSADDTLDYAYGVSASYPNDPLYLSAKYLEIGEDFNPGLGFVRRRGVRAFSTFASYKHRPANESWYLSIETKYSNEFFYHLDGALDSSKHSLSLFEIDLASTDGIELSISRETDHPLTDFNLFDDITIPTGDYDWNNVKATFKLSGKRALWGKIGAETGGFYGGTRTKYFTDLRWSPMRHFGLALNYQYNDIEFDDGNIGAHVASANMEINVTPDLSWSNLVQYDSVSNSIGFNSRLRWEYRPGATAYVVLNQTYLNELGRFESEGTDFSMKVGTSFRF